MLDKDGQLLNRSINWKRNREKAAFGLRGILAGITADRTLNEQELLFLDVWLKSQTYLQQDEDIEILIEFVRNALENPGQQIDTSALLLHIDKLISIDFPPPLSIDGFVNELLGLIDGIAADGKLHDLEALKIGNWLCDHPEVALEWPGSTLVDRLRRIFEDGVITDDEREDFIETIKQITGCRPEETGQVTGTATEFLEDAVDQLLFEGKTFCFTGKFVSGTRQQVETIAIERGASTASDVSKKVDYLVIGIEASRDWKFASYGRKIEQAINLKRAGVPILILTERRWLELEKAAS